MELKEKRKNLCLKRRSSISKESLYESLLKFFFYQNDTKFIPLFTASRRPTATATSDDDCDSAALAAAVDRMFITGARIQIKFPF